MERNKRGVLQQSIRILLKKAGASYCQPAHHRALFLFFRTMHREFGGSLLEKLIL